MGIGASDSLDAIRVRDTLVIDNSGAIARGHAGVGTRAAGPGHAGVTA